MPKILLFLTLFSACIIASETDKKLYLNKIDGKIEIDGLIDPFWEKADSISDFIQYAPYNNQDPTRKTVAKILANDEDLYCLMICYDDKINIQANAGKHDDFTGDIVSIMFDTFDDKKTAYKFAVNASGVRADSKLLDDARNRDYSWDGIWFADSRIYEWGYIIEMRIPFKSIQYNENLNEWGLDFDRWIPATTEDIYWASYEPAVGQRISKFGRLVFNDFKPTAKGLNLEIYPVGIMRANYLYDGKYKMDPDAGIDISYNPSPKLTFQFTANPDFAQIEADPFDFNISRYESRYDEKRPFFTEGQEIFNPSGKERSSGFYRPLELFYSRRIGRILPDGNQVPIIFGAKAFGRLGDWEYGGFAAGTGEEDYDIDSLKYTEQRALFTSVRLKKHILDNSSIGVLYVGKSVGSNLSGVIDIDGAFRGSNWQFVYQAARSIENEKGAFGGALGFRKMTKKWITLFRSKFIEKDFNIDQVGYVPWKGVTDATLLTGPVFYNDKGILQQTMIYFGGSGVYEHDDLYTDHDAIVGLNMQFRSNWGYEINFSGGKSKDSDVKYDYFEGTYSSWFDISPNWHMNAYGGYSKQYNFDRGYTAFYSWAGGEFSWKAIKILELGTTYDMYVEGNPSNEIEDITYTARPYFSFTPVNDLNLRLYVDNVFLRSSDKLERVIVGLLFSYSFSPKSWIYFAFNEVRSRTAEYDEFNNPLPAKLHTTGRAGALKIKYLYYF